MSIFIEQDIEVGTHLSFRPRHKFKNKAKSNKLAFADSVRSIHLVSRIFGFTPFSFVFKNGEILRARVGSLDFLWLIISLTIYAILIYTCPYKLPLLFQASPALIYEHYIQLVLGLSKAIVTIILDLFNRHRITNILIDLNRFDKRVSLFSQDANTKKFSTSFSIILFFSVNIKQLENLGIFIDYGKCRKKLRRYRFTVLLLALAMTTTSIILSAPRFGKQISTFNKIHFAIAHTLHVGGIMATGTSYILLVHSLSTRFTIISGLLKFDMTEYINVASFQMFQYI